MRNKVTNYQEVKYDLDTKIEALHWDDFIVEVKCTEFYEDGDYYAVYENLDEPDDHERRKYAIYQHNTGKLICLLADSGLVLDLCYDDEDYKLKRDELYKQIAMLAGWPEKIEVKKPYTVTLKRTINMKVYAANEQEARTIGEALAAGATISACMAVNEAMCNGDDEFESVSDCYKAKRWHQGELSKEECDELLKKED